MNEMSTPPHWHRHPSTLSIQPDPETQFAERVNSYAIWPNGSVTDGGSGFDKISGNLSTFEGGCDAYHFRTLFVLVTFAFKKKVKLEVELNHCYVAETGNVHSFLWWILRPKKMDDIWMDVFVGTSACVHPPKINLCEMNLLRNNSIYVWGS